LRLGCSREFRKAVAGRADALCVGVQCDPCFHCKKKPVFRRTSTAPIQPKVPQAPVRPQAKCSIEGTVVSRNHRRATQADAFDPAADRRAWEEMEEDTFANYRGHYGPLQGFYANQ